MLFRHCTNPFISMVLSARIDVLLVRYGCAFSARLSFFSNLSFDHLGASLMIPASVGVMSTS